MPQTLINISNIADKAAAEKIVAAGEALDKVKFVNVNIDDGRIVITHDADFDIAAFNTVLQSLGYSI